MENRLFRVDTHNKVLAGVALGLANYFKIDKTLVRIIFVCLVLTGGFGILAYIALWAILPVAYTENMADASFEADPNNGSEFDEVQDKISSNPTPYILIGLGVLFMFNNFLPDFDMGKFWPLILIAIGVYQIANPRQKRIKQYSKKSESNSSTEDPLNL